MASSLLEACQNRLTAFLLGHPRERDQRRECGQGRVRVLEIEGVDVQPCGGTHVSNTADIGAVVVTKIEKKSAMTRRVVLGFAPAAADRS